MSGDPQQKILPIINLALSQKNQAVVSYQRRMMVLSGEHVWCQSLAQALLRHLASKNACWIGEGSPETCPSFTNKAALSLLGTETELIIYDTHTGFDPDAFGALCGTLVGGGLLILLTPPLSAWSSFADPEHTRICVAGIPTSAVSGRFLGRLARLIQEDASIMRIEQGFSLPNPPEQISANTSNVAFDEQCRTRDQATAVEAVLQVVCGHRRRPVVLISDRGRGKSSALGIAAARLIDSGKRHILVTAPRLAATQSLFEQAARHLGPVKSGKGVLHVEDCSITYHAPDHLLQRPQTADLLLVDEAAAIPTPLLEALLTCYPRIAFATTVHGYEGTGKGFALRFRQILNRRFPQWREIRLHTPIRWAEGDPLEKWLFASLALDASPAPNERIAGAQPGTCRFEALDRRELALNERDLRDLFGLLVLAHYRTSPIDLRHVLDGPNLLVYVLRYRERILATALVALEGGFDAQTAHAIWSGVRRPRGHLLAQSLAAHVGLEAGARLRGARIMRIAVHPQVQLQGMGSRLVTEILTQTESTGLDYLGTSFGATAELIRFWSKLRLLPIRIGLRRGASSGTQSVIMLHPVSGAGEQIYQTARQRFTRALPRLLSDALHDMDPDVACSLLTHCSARDLPPLDHLDWLDLSGFAFALRGYEASLPAIEELALRALIESHLQTEHARLLLVKVMQHRDWQTCATCCHLAGRAAVDRALREVVGQLVLHYADDSVREIALRIQAERPG
ncbi:MAG: GNAT family N-acetyltransferase [Gammaproteobacteria bacterium]|nr:GNAT family N-acetyltransferase [Gammaproteobacteria bacterium]